MRRRRRRCWWKRIRGGGIVALFVVYRIDGYNRTSVTFDTVFYRKLDI